MRRRRSPSAASGRRSCTRADGPACRGRRSTAAAAPRRSSRPSSAPRWCRANAPSPANILGLAMGGPTVIAHGTEEQKERFVEPILSGEEIWCQGFSEPESGSDLASLKTKAVKDNGELGGHRPEGLDHVRPSRQVVHARGAHRHRGAQAQGPHLLPDGHGAGRRAGAPASPDHGTGRVQRALHRGGAHPRRERRRRRG